MLYRRQINIFALILFFLSLFIPLIQYHIERFGYFGISAVFINDTQSYWENIISYHDGKEGNYFTLIGVLILYYPAYFLGWLYCYFVNFTLLILSCLFFLKTIRLIKLKFSNYKIFATFILVIFNFYLWGILFFPNKEIPLIFLTNVLIYIIASRKSKLISLVPVVLIFFFRDGFAFILFCTMLMIWFLGKGFEKNPIRILLSFIFVLMFFSLKTLSSLGILSDYQYVIDRNIAYESESSFAYNSPYYFSYLINLFNNSIIYAFRAQLFDQNGRLYFHGIGLWQFAVVLTIGLISWIKKTFFTKHKNSTILHIGLIVLLSYLLLSTSTYPQVRYMMPFSFWLSAAVFFYLDFRTFVFLYILVLILAISFIFLGLSHKPGLGIDIDDFSKSLFSN